MNERERKNGRNKKHKKENILIFLFCLLSPAIYYCLFHFIRFGYYNFENYNKPFAEKYKRTIYSIYNPIMDDDCNMYITSGTDNKGYKIIFSASPNYGKDRLTQNAVKVYHSVADYAAENNDTPLSGKPLTLSFFIEEETDCEGTLIYSGIELRNYYYDRSGDLKITPSKCADLRLFANGYANGSGYENYDEYSTLINEFADEIISVHISGLTNIDVNLKEKLPKLEKYSVTERTIQ